MNIKSLYHCHSLNYLKAREAGFTHVEVSVNAWPGNFQTRMMDAIRTAHEMGIKCIIDPGFERQNEAFDLLAKIKEYLDPNDIIYLPDEPNRKITQTGMFRDHSSSESLKEMTVKIPRMRENRLYFIREDLRKIGILNKTMVVLSDIASYWGYNNSADIIGFDFYKPSMFKLYKHLILKVWPFLQFNKTELIAVPAIRSPEYIIAQWKAWKRFGFHNFFWYASNLEEEGFGKGTLFTQENEKLLEALKHCNN